MTKWCCYIQLCLNCLFSFSSLAAQTQPVVVFPILGDGGGYKFELFLSNPATWRDQGTIYFKDPGGRPLIISLDGVTRSSLPYSLRPGAVLKVASDGIGELRTGYVVVSSSHPGSLLTGSLTYTVYDQLRVSVPDSKRSRQYHSYAIETMEYSSGVAFLNPNQEPIDIQLALIDRNAQVIQQVILSLESGEQRSRFLHEIYDQVPFEFYGSVHAVSDSDFMMFGIRQRRKNGSLAILAGSPSVFDPGIKPFESSVQSIVFPQIADGDGTRTEFVLTSTCNESIDAEIRFWETSGQPLALNLNGEDSTSLPFFLPPGGTVTTSSAGSGNLSVGYATLDYNSGSDCLSGSVIFELNGFEVSVPATHRTERFHLYVESDHQSDSGIALVNTNSRDIEVNVDLRDSKGLILDTELVHLDSGKHSAKFVTEIFKNLPDDFRGSVHLESQEGHSTLGINLRRHDGALAALSGAPSSFPADFAATSTSQSEFPAIAVHSSGEKLLVMASEDGYGSIPGGTVWLDSDDSNIVVRLGSNGFPTSIFSVDYVYLFSNYTSSTVDVAVADPEGNNEIHRRLLFEPDFLKNLETELSIQRSSDSQMALGALVKYATAATNIGACLAASINSVDFTVNLVCESEVASAVEIAFNENTGLTNLYDFGSVGCTGDINDSDCIEQVIAAGIAAIEQADQVESASEFVLAQIGSGLDAPCSFSFDTVKLNLGSSTSQHELSIQTPTHCKWSANTSDDWIASDGLQRVGPGILRLDIESNQSGSQRHGVVIIQGHALTINQSSDLCSRGLIREGETIYSRIDSGDCDASPRGTGYLAEAWTINLTSGQTVRVEGRPFDLIWQVTDPAGQTVFGTPNDNWHFTPDTDGDYTLWVTSEKLGQQADYLFSVSSGDCIVTLSSLLRQHEPEAGTAEFHIETANGCPWQVTNWNSWLNAVPTSGSGSGTVQYFLDENALNESRNGLITVASQELPIHQAGGTWCSRKEISFGERIFSRIDSEDCEASPRGKGFYSEAWTLSGLRGQAIRIEGDQEGLVWNVTDPIGENVFGTENDNWLYTLETDGEYTIWVTTESSSQHMDYSYSVGSGDCIVTLSSNDRQHEPESGGGRLLVNTEDDCPWQVITWAPWLSVQPPNGVGSESIQYFVEENAETSSRKGLITVADKELTIEQAGGNWCTRREIRGGEQIFSRIDANDCQASPRGDGFYAEAWILTGARGLSIRIGGDPEGLVWNVTDPTGQNVFGTQNDNWLYTLEMDGDHTIWVTTESSHQQFDYSFTVNHGDCVLTLSSSVRHQEPEASLGEVWITTASDCPWQVTSGESWLDVLPENGKGSGSFQYLFLENELNAGREGLITVSDQELWVRQAGGNQCTHAEISCGEEITSQLGPDDCEASPKGDGYYTKAWTFDGFLGQTIVVPGTQNNLIWYVTDSTGQVVYGSVSEKWRYTLETDGPHKIWVTTDQAEKTTDLRIQLVCD